MSDVTVYQKNEWGRGGGEKHETGVHEIESYFDLKSRNNNQNLDVFVSKHLILCSSVNLPILPSAASIIVQASQTSWSPISKWFDANPMF